MTSSRPHPTWRLPPLRAVLLTLAALAPVAAIAQGEPQHLVATTPVASCESLAELALPQGTVTLAETVAAGEFDATAYDPNFFTPYNIAGRVDQGSNPAFCRMAATLTPSSDSDIRMEVWLPQQGWNGKFLGVGNYGWGGSINYAGLLAGLQKGFAGANNDTGHQDGSGQFVVGHPEKLVDYAYRANHEMTVDAKQVVEVFFGTPPTHSYWVGCSLGGLQGLIEAERYPEDYDALIIGAPPNPLVDFNALQLWPSWLVNEDPRRFIPEEKYAMIHDAVVARCGTEVGRNDNLVDDPASCDFEPASLLCEGVDAPDCLTAPQVFLLEQTYSGPSNPRTGEMIYPGPARGSELDMFTFAQTEPMRVALDLFASAAFEDPDWDFRTMDWDQTLLRAEQKLGPLLHVGTDLTAFFDRGGKILFYLGWNDTHNPEQLIGYCDALVRDSGANAQGATVLFAIPGMGHCGGGQGCDSFDRISALDHWVEEGEAPDHLLGLRVAAGDVVRSRPHCAHPAIARYTGQGDINDATNFVCSAE